MSSNKAEASPVPVSINTDSTLKNDEGDKVNFLNLQCHIAEKLKMPKTQLSYENLRERLIAVLITCHSALHQTKHLTDNYVSSF
jgi:hypothetical protein